MSSSVHFVITILHLGSILLLSTTTTLTTTDGTTLNNCTKSSLVAECVAGVQLPLHIAPHSSIFSSSKARDEHYFFLFQFKAYLRQETTHFFQFDLNFSLSFEVEVNLLRDMDRNTSSSTPLPAPPLVVVVRSQDTHTFCCEEKSFYYYYLLQILMSKH